MCKYHRFHASMFMRDHIWLPAKLQLDGFLDIFVFRRQPSVLIQMGSPQTTALPRAVFMVAGHASACLTCGQCGAVHDRISHCREDPVVFETGNTNPSLFWALLGWKCSLGTIPMNVKGYSVCLYRGCGSVFNVPM